MTGAAAAAGGAGAIGCALLLRRGTGERGAASTDSEPARMALCRPSVSRDEGGAPCTGPCTDNGQGRPRSWKTVLRTSAARMGGGIHLQDIQRETHIDDGGNIGPLITVNCQQ